MRKTAHTTTAAALGFHIIVEAKRTANFLVNSEASACTAMIQTRSQYLTENPGFCTSWSGTLTDKNLQEIFNDFRVNVDKFDDMQADLARSSQQVPMVSG